MFNRTTLRLKIPDRDKPYKYFSFPLKTNSINEPSKYYLPKKLLVIANIEGNFMSFRRLLIKNRIIDNVHNWIFEDGHLVIAGYCFDRGEEVIECLWFIYSLEEKAERSGGYVHLILGNQEIMNLNGEWRYYHPKYAEPAIKKAGMTALYDGNNSLWKWLNTKNIIERIGNILIVHGGIAPELASYNYSINEINSIARAHYNHANMAFDHPLLKLIFNTDKSPLWYKGYYNGTVNQIDIDKILNIFDVHTIITGHAPVNQICTFFDKKVINVNTNNRALESEALLIRKDKFYRVDSNGNRERIK